MAADEQDTDPVNYFMPLRLKLSEARIVPEGETSDTSKPEAPGETPPGEYESFFSLFRTTLGLGPTPVLYGIGVWIMQDVFRSCHNLCYIVLLQHDFACGV